MEKTEINDCKVLFAPWIPSVEAYRAIVLQKSHRFGVIQSQATKIWRNAFLTTIHGVDPLTLLQHLLYSRDRWKTTIRNSVEIKRKEFFSWTHTYNKTFQMWGKTEHTYISQTNIYTDWNACRRTFWQEGIGDDFFCRNYFCNHNWIWFVRFVPQSAQLPASI